MGESDLQAIGGKNFKRYVESIERENKEKSGYHLKDLLKNFSENGKVYEALTACIQAYSSDFLDSDCLEILVGSIVRKAKDYLEKNSKLTYGHFMCATCCDVSRDPVTLKCGHTFSKKCVLAVSKGDLFTCEKCKKSYSYAYLSQLKNNVKISAFIETVLKHISLEDFKSTQAATHDNIGKKCERKEVKTSHKKDSVDCKENHLSILLNPTSPKDYLSKGNLLVNMGKHEDALGAYLISCTLDSSIIQAKEKSIKLFHKLLLNATYKFSSTKSSFDGLSIKIIELNRRKSLAGSDESLCSVESCDSLVLSDDDCSSGDENNVLSEDWKEVHRNECTEARKLHASLKAFFNDIEKIAEENSITEKIDASLFDKRDFECPLCMRTLWQPISTPCGHTFCRVCLNRSFDHQIYCPLCKTSLSNFLAERVQNTTEFVEVAIRSLFPDDYLERKAIHEEEMEELSNAGEDSEHVIPLFVCTIAYPTVPCPLHVFEPRYRLMIRQCMESGSRQFGMCAYIDDNIAEYGTMLEIRDVQYFPDGRSVVHTTGSNRFRVLRKGERDGYHTAAVEFLKDETCDDDNVQEITEKHDRVYKASQSWFMHLPTDTKCQIVEHFGPMPAAETSYINTSNGPSWFWWMLAVLPLEPRLQLTILSMRSLLGRLNYLGRILLHLKSIPST